MKVDKLYIHVHRCESGDVCEKVEVCLKVFITVKKCHSKTGEVCAKVRCN